MSRSFPNIKTPTTLPRGGAWVYYDPDLGRVFEYYGMLDDFPVVVAEARKVNGLPVPANDVLEKQIEEYICRNAPAGTCRGDYVDSWETKKYTLTTAKIANFTRTLVQAVRTRCLDC